MKQIIIRPMITEKAEKLSTKKNQYTFVVARDVNKIEVSKAIEKMYNVSVESVNTLMMPGKAKSRNSRNAVIKGRKPSYKKAMVTLKAGDEINIFGE
ncbi:MAG: 50S ribosomal protein L23 [Saprospiraceae bacterium]|nr:50S ribosomal protein L23 [Saprospiraceae bacterium]MBK7737429.1 50S ribosomal protein L23 [Saprospiraceae bacterium]MBK7913991.1 50S ribosomal protein L23 [Saprospiraceae bacterium]